MNRIISVLLLSLVAVILLVACPRETGNAGTSSTDTPVTKKTESDVKQDTPVVDADQMTEEEKVTEEVADEKVEGNEETPVEGEEVAEDAEAVDAGDEATEEDATGEKMTEEPKEGVVNVVFETTQGNIVFEVHEEWSPIGAKHFIELVEDGFYNGAPWFRVINGFVAQCGISADPEMNKKWSEATIMDEPVVMSNKPGYVAFGKSQMPNSRSTHIFINYGDNSRSLDPQGFSCFAVLDEASFEVANKLAKVEWPDQGGLAALGGLDRFKTRFPEADFIEKAYVQK